ncbi:sulfate ABC transporter substrate-binding protein [Aeromicrobium terrae]|uniref:Sulfate ABC transporter substrate-binding protein n=1 Tax=Aeromicrobium terrae TaxID=2498846 RepID=A0A5C8ND60_9ACTN|nr:sulfate ABC transporter substrate-binding protein [Aeromicrobium terrae]TXL57442.1 sulfate ABC transporter substrate-binding protein [Aeromicrobium terrae]
MHRTVPFRRRPAVVTALLLAASVILASCADTSGDSDSAKGNVSIVGFSVMQTANKKVIADFKKTDEGKDISFKESYGASGDQARSVIAGLKADEAHLSLEPDVAKLVDAGLVADSWKDNANKGILTQSVVVFVVRKGNPKNLKTWADLAKPGVEIVSPNPGSSGSAKWNILAAWGSAGLGADDGDASATAFITKLLKNIVAFPGSGHDATTAFQGGTGDVLLSYENEAIQAKQAGLDADYVVPDTTLLIQNPVALTKDASEASKTFLEYQLSDAAQKVYATFGFRPLNPDIKVSVKGANSESDPFPQPTTLLTIDDDFGGWSEANKKFFDEKNGIITKLLAKSGKS